MSILFNISFNALNSSSLKVIPLPIFSCSGSHSLISYLALLLFQLTKFNSFFHPFYDSDITPYSYSISNLIPAILILLCKKY